MPPVGLRERRDSDSGKADFQHAVDVGKVVGQSLDAEIIDYFLTHQRSIARLIVVTESVAKLVEQVRAQRLRIRDVEGPRIADLPKLADGGEIPFEAPAVGAVPGPTAEYERFVGKAMVDAGGVVEIRIERPVELRAVVLTLQRRGAAGIRQWIEAVLDALGDRADARRGNEISGEGSGGGERISDHCGRREGREVALAPGRQRYGGVHQ